MPGVKRILERPWATRRMGGYIVLREVLIASLKKGEAADFERLLVGTRQLVSLLKLLPHEHCLVKTNGRLEIETVEMTYRKANNGYRRAHYRKPKHLYHQMVIIDRAWLPGAFTSVVVIKPRRF